MNTEADIADAMKQVREETAGLTPEEKRERGLKAARDLDVSDRDLDDLKLMLFCYLDITNEPGGFDDLIGVSKKTIEIYIAKMKMEAVKMKELDDTSVKDADSFAFGVLVGMSTGIELTKRRHA